MFLEELVLEGFKSYATRTVIKGWDPEFNAITGLNGSGKSNILDALCFILGMDNLRNIRATSLQDLVYKRGQAGINKATVTAVFNNADPRTSPVGFHDCKQIVLSRQIVLGGKNKYMVNGVTVPQHTIENLLQSVQINIQHPHFLIMQGKITKILNMKPGEIGAMIEEAAGTRMYQDRKEKAALAIKKKDAKLEEIKSNLKDVIHPKLNKLRTERSALMEYQVLQRDLSSIEKQVESLRYYMTKGHLQLSEKDLESQQSALNSFTGLLSERETELKNLEKDLASRQRVSSFTNELTTAESEHKAALLEHAKLTSRLEALTKEEESLKKRQITLQRTKSNDKHSKPSDEAKDREELTSFQAKYQSLQITLSEKKRELSALEELIFGLETGLSKNIKSSNEASSTGVVGFSKLLTDEKRHRSELENKKSLLNVTLAEYKRNSQLLLKKQPAWIKREEEITSNITNEQDRIDCLRAKIAKLQEKQGSLVSLQSNQTNGQNNKRAVAQIETMEQELNSAFQGIKSAWKFSQNIFPSKSDHGDINDVTSPVLGYVGCNLHVEDISAVTAVEVTAGARLWNVIVQDEGTASVLLERGNLNKRVTFLPLNRIIAGQCVPAAKMERISKEYGSKAILAIDCIRFSPKLLSVMQYIFGNTMICNDAETARAIAYDRNLGIRCVTLEGDVYDPSGTLTGGASNTKSRQPILTQEEKSEKSFHTMASTISFSKVLLDQLSTLQPSSFAALNRISSSSANLCIEAIRKHRKSILGLEHTSSQTASEVKHLEGELDVALHTFSLLQKSLSSDSLMQDKISFEKINSSISQATEEMLVLEKSLQLSNEKLDTYTSRMEGYNASVDKVASLAKLSSQIVALKEDISSLSKSTLAMQKQKNLLEKKLEDQLAEQEQRDKALASLLTELAEISTTRHLLLDEQIPRANLALSLTKAALDDLLEKVAIEQADVLSLQTSISELSQEIELGKSRLRKITVTVSTLRSSCAENKTLLCKLEKDHPWLLSEHLDIDYVVNTLHARYSSLISSNTSKNKNSILSKESIDSAALQSFQAGLIADRKKLALQSGQINLHVLDHLASVENKESTLLNQLNIIQSDKYKILETIEKLNAFEIDTRQTTFHSVQAAFTSIVSILLPGARGELVLLSTSHTKDNTEDPDAHVKSPNPSTAVSTTESINHIFAVDICISFGEKLVSLRQLSGGQRSLVALGYLFSLLVVHPAPFYILDEIDSALDLSHTQAIGKLIKSYEKLRGAQFIIVSLKDGFFTNANVLFKTTFVDGKSAVERFEHKKTSEKIKSREFSKRQVSAQYIQSTEVTTQT